MEHMVVRSAGDSTDSTCYVAGRTYPKYPKFCISYKLSRLAT